MDVTIIDYGAGNIQSIQFAFQRLGVNAKLSNSVQEIQNADKVIFPGVGEASQAMEMLKKSKLDLFNFQTLKTRTFFRHFVLGIANCLLQSISEEGQIPKGTLEFF